MWVLHNDTPFSAGRGGYRDRHGREVWMGVVRASFDIGSDGRVKRAERQTPPLEVATWAGEPGRSSLLDDCDYQPKQGTDVIVRGFAHAPANKTVTELEVGLRLGPLHKALIVHGPRSWVRGAAASEVIPGPAQSFEKQALDYEHAFGGHDRQAPPGQPAVCVANPVGSGFAHDPSLLIGSAAPQLELPGVPLVAGPHQHTPAGWGAIGPHWQPRLALAGTYDAAWQEHRAPLPPDDYDENFRRSAPRDQQLPGHLRGGEQIELTHMTPEGTLRVQLPSLSVEMITIFSDGTERSAAPLHTVLVLPSERRLELTYLAETPCHGREHKLQRARLTCPGERAWQ